MTKTRSVPGNDCDVTEDLTDTQSVSGNDCDAHLNLIGNTFSPMVDCLVTEDIIGTQLLPKNNPMTPTLRRPHVSFRFKTMMTSETRSTNTPFGFQKLP